MSAMAPDLALLLLARGLLRVCKPLLAHAILVRIGGLLPPLRTPEEARLAARRMAKRGSCLSRSLAIASRASAAEVVIAIAPKENTAVFAHAWVEMDGAPLEDSEAFGTVIARLRGRAVA
jgi:hypothetical protein